MRISIFFTLVLVILVTGQNVFAKSKSEKIDQIIKHFQNKDLFNGTVLIKDNGKLIYNNNIGFANIKIKEKISRNTIFPLCSVTKQFTATGILILEQENSLSLDDRIIEYLSETPDCAKEITLRQLLTHTSGLPDYLWANVPNHNDSILYFFSNLDSLQSSPGEEYQYCNLGYALCGIVIERVTDQTYADFMKTKIFDPLEMKNSFVYERHSEVPNVAMGYDPKWEENKFLMVTGDGGILSTANDLLKWDQALYSNKILTPASIAKLHTPMILNNGKKIEYGLGVEITEVSDGKFISHAGSLAGYGAFIGRNIDNQSTIILLSNRLLPELITLLDYLEKILRDEKFEFPEAD